MKALSLLIVVFLCGCATAPGVKDSESVAKATKRQDDAYTGSYFIEGPKYHAKPMVATWGIVASGKSGQPVTLYSITGMLHYSTWTYPQTAHTSDGRLLPIRVAPGAVTSSGVAEGFQIEVTRDYLESCRTAGVDIRVDGAMQHFVRLPSWYVDGFLKAVDR